MYVMRTILESYQAGLFQKKFRVPNIISGVIVAVVALPLAMAGTRHDSNRELIGQGLANIAAPLFGGFAATGAIARTATNIRNGGKCRNSTTNRRAN